jgi:hypothetical protein
MDDRVALCRLVDDELALATGALEDFRQHGKIVRLPSREINRTAEFF